MAVVRSKNASPTWGDVKAALLDFDRLVQDLYTASKDNQAFLHARLGLGHDQLQPLQGEYFEMDVPGPNERPVGIGFESQEGDCGLQESHRALGWNSGTVDVLLRGGIWLSRILQHGR